MSFSVDDGETGFSRGSCDVFFHTLSADSVLRSAIATITVVVDPVLLCLHSLARLMGPGFSAYCRVVLEPCYQWHLPIFIALQHIYRQPVTDIFALSHHHGEVNRHADMMREGLIVW